MEEVHLSVSLSRPPHEVWVALFDHGVRRLWWGQRVEIRPELGASFYEYWRDGDGRDRTSKGKVLELTPDALLRVSWQDDDWPQLTELALRLKAHGKGTLLELDHTDFDKLGTKLHYNIEEYEQGWTTLLDELKLYLEGPAEELTEALQDAAAGLDEGLGDIDVLTDKEASMEFEEFLDEVRKRVKSTTGLDADTFRAKVDEVVADLGRGARVAKDKLDEWNERANKSWPEVEKSIVKFGEVFVASITAFAEAFRVGYKEKKADKEDKDSPRESDR